MGTKDDPTDHSNDVFSQLSKAGWLDRQTHFVSELGFHVNTFGLGNLQYFHALQETYKKMDDLIKYWQRINAADPYNFYKSRVEDPKIQEANSALTKERDRTNRMRELNATVNNQYQMKKNMEKDLRDKINEKQDNLVEYSNRLKRFGG